MTGPSPRRMPDLVGGMAPELAPDPTSQTWRRAVNLSEEVARGMREWDLHCYLPVQYLAAFRFLVEGWDVMAQIGRSADATTDQLALVVLVALQHLSSAATTATAPPALGSATKILVVCPTWSLTTTVRRVLLEVGRYTDVTCFDCSQQESTHNSVARAQVVVGTPNQILKKIRDERSLHPDHVSVLVTYQIDELVAQRLQRSLITLYSLLPQGHQMLFTATRTNPEVVDLLFQLRGSPFVLSDDDNPARPPVHTMPQYYLDLAGEDRFDMFISVVEICGIEKAAVLCGSRASAETVQQKCKSEPISSTWIPYTSSTSQAVVSTPDADSRILVIESLTDENPFEVPRVLFLYDCSSALAYKRAVDMFGNVRPDGIAVVLIASQGLNALVTRLEEITERRIKALPEDAGDTGILR